MQDLNTAITKSQLNSVQEIPYDVAWTEGSTLENAVRTEKGGVTVFSGRHKEHGDIHIIIPAVGDGLLLFPFVVQDF